MSEQVQEAVAEVCKGNWKKQRKSGIILTISEVSGHAEPGAEEKTPSEQPKTDKAVDSAKSGKEGENENAAGDAQANEEEWVGFESELIELFYFEIFTTEQS